MLLQHSEYNLYPGLNKELAYYSTGQKSFSQNQEFLQRTCDIQFTSLIWSSYLYCCLALQSTLPCVTLNMNQLILVTQLDRHSSVLADHIPVASQMEVAFKPADLAQCDCHSQEFCP